VEDDLIAVSSGLEVDLLRELGGEETGSTGEEEVFFARFILLGGWRRCCLLLGCLRFRFTVSREEFWEEI
jgi:hypothetical protein